MIVHSAIVPEPTDPLAELVTRRPELGPISLAAKVREAVRSNA